MEQSRVSVRDSFSKQIKTMPYILNINGENEWVDDYIKFGDLIEEHMGKDARDFYFEQLYELLLENEAVEEEKPKEKKNGSKSGKTVRTSSKRLF